MCFCLLSSRLASLKKMPANIPTSKIHNILAMIEIWFQLMLQTIGLEASVKDLDGTTTVLSGWQFKQSKISSHSSLCTNTRQRPRPYSSFHYLYNPHEITDFFQPFYQSIKDVLITSSHWFVTSQLPWWSIKFQQNFRPQWVSTQSTNISPFSKSILSRWFFLTSR